MFGSWSYFGVVRCTPESRDLQTCPRQSARVLRNRIIPDFSQGYTALENVIDVDGKPAVEEILEDISDKEEVAPVRLRTTGTGSVISSAEQARKERQTQVRSECAACSED